MSKVLIIDDDAVFRQAAGDLLRAESIEVSEAEDGEKGLEAVKADRPDLILLDIEMPNLDGIGFLKALRESDENKNVAVLITSNRSGLDTISEGVELGVRGYIVKASMPLPSIVEQVQAELEK